MRTLSTMRSAMMARMRVRGTGSAGRLRQGSAAAPARPAVGQAFGRAMVRPSGAQHVIFANAATGAGAGDAAQVDAVLFGDAARQRRRADATCGGGSLLNWILWRRRHLAAGQRLSVRRLVESVRRQWRRDRSPGLADHRDHRVDFDGSAFGKADLSQHAGNRRGNLRVHLVGRDLKERLVNCDGVADLLEPFGDRALEDRLAHLGHDDFRWHASFFRAADCTGSCRIINRVGSLAQRSAGLPPQATTTVSWNSPTAGQDRLRKIFKDRRVSGTTVGDMPQLLPGLAPAARSVIKPEWVAPSRARQLAQALDLGRDLERRVFCRKLLGRQVPARQRE